MLQDPSGKIQVKEMFKTKTGCLFITFSIFNAINVSENIAWAVKSLIFISWPHLRLSKTPNSCRCWTFHGNHSPLHAPPWPKKTPSSPLLSQISCHRPLDPFLIFHGGRPGLAIDPGSQVGLSTRGLNQTHVWAEANCTAGKNEQFEVKSTRRLLRRTQLDVLDLFVQTLCLPAEPQKNCCFLRMSLLQRLQASVAIRPWLQRGDIAPPSQTPRGSAQQSSSRENAGLFTSQWFWCRATGRCVGSDRKCC